MKNLINNIGWTGLAVTILAATVFSSCKKDKSKPDPKPVPPAVIPITTVGANYKGGTVFYLDASQQHGYIMTPTDLSIGIKWYDYANNQIFPNNFDPIESMGWGAKNTRFISDHYGAGNYAAYICDTLNLNGYDDWFLPSTMELNVMISKYPNYNLSTDPYWSSSETGTNTAYSTRPNGFGGSTQGKSNLHRVRAIRAF